MKVNKGLRERHGMHGTRAYSVWCAMRRRCTGKNTPGFQNYGGRGITVCDRWQKFTNFYTDMGDPPEGMSIERINNDLGYSPENCKWATPLEQARNRRNLIQVTIGNETKCLKDWASVYGIAYGTAYQRILHGWDQTEALTTPLLRGGRR